MDSVTLILTISLLGYQNVGNICLDGSICDGYCTPEVNVVLECPSTKEYKEVFLTELERNSIIKVNYVKSLNFNCSLDEALYGLKIIDKVLGKDIFLQTGKRFSNLTDDYQLNKIDDPKISNYVFWYKTKKSCDHCYFGDKCDLFIKESPRLICDDKGVVICKKGWTNPKSACSDIDFCIKDGICSGHGNCTNISSKNFYCLCDIEYFGKNCQYKNPCVSANPCKNRSICQALDENNVKCICMQPWTGEHCDKKEDPRNITTAKPTTSDIIPGPQPIIPDPYVPDHLPDWDKYCPCHAQACILVKNFPKDNEEILTRLISDKCELLLRKTYPTDQWNVDADLHREEINCKKLITTISFKVLKNSIHLPPSEFYNEFFSNDMRSFEFTQHVLDPFNIELIKQIPMPTTLNPLPPNEKHLNGLEIFGYSTLCVAIVSILTFIGIKVYKKRDRRNVTIKSYYA